MSDASANTAVAAGAAVTGSAAKTPFYLTTAIDYANGAPHLGHAYEKVLADVIARFHRMSGENVRFLTGLDEHGQKVQQNAEKRGVSPQQACDETAVLFQKLLADLNITNDDYIRTTEPRHKAVVQKFLQQLFDSGDIYKGEYTGFYSVRQEQFVLEKDRLPDGAWPEIFGEVSRVTEPCYFFRLSKYTPWLREFLADPANADFVFPRFRQKQAVEFLKDDVNDLCISRPRERLAWGIPLPFDDGFVTYVWFDALVNYASAVAGNPAGTDWWASGAHHVIGKDILVPPHAIYWPCMLKALGLALPKQLIVHGWWTLAGSKASKSTGNATSSLELARLYGADTFRYFVMREMVVGQDSDFSADQFRLRYRSDLGNDLGNLLNRLLNMGGRYCAGKVPAALGGERGDVQNPLPALWLEIQPRYLELAGGYKFHEALDTLWKFIRAMNAFVEQRAPWKLGKSEDPKDRALLDDTLAHLAEGLRLVAVALTPVMPTIAAAIQRNIGVEPATSFFAAAATAAGNAKSLLDWDFSRTAGATLAAKAILFPPIEEPPAA